MDDHHGSSPMDYIPLQKLLLTAMNVVEADNRSPIIKRAHGTVLFIWRTFFLHVGCILQNVALFTAQTPAAALRVPFVALTVTKLVIKGAVFLIGRREIDEMWQRLKDEGSRTKNAQEMKYIEDAKFYIRVVNYYGLVYCLNIIVFILIPMLKHALPFIFWYPFDPYASADRYHCLFVYEVICTFACSATNLSVNTYMFVVFICLNFYYSLLSERVQSVGHRHNDGSRSPQSKEDIYHQMIEMINFHLRINEFVAKTLILSNDFLFVQIVQAALCFALSAMVLLLVDLHGGDALVPILFLITNGLEMYIYCYLANNITHTYDTISKTTKAMLLLMQITGAREMKIQTVGFVRFELGLGIFMKISRTTYSLITLIRSV